MQRLIKESIQIARKDYNCIACKAFTNWGSIDDYELEADERLAFRCARANNFQIKKGMKYIKQIFACGNEIIVYRAIIEIHQMAIKYEMFDN